MGKKTYAAAPDIPKSLPSQSNRTAGGANIGLELGFEAVNQL